MAFQMHKRTIRFSHPGLPSSGITLPLVSELDLGGECAACAQATNSGSGRTSGRLVLCAPVGRARAPFTSSDEHELNETEGPDPQKLQCVPNAQQNRHVQPSRRAVINEARADARGDQVRRSEEHRGYAPLEASPGADGVEEDVGGHVAAQECAGVDAEGPELADHDGSPLLRGLATKNLEGLPGGRHTVTLGVTATHI